MKKLIKKLDDYHNSALGILVQMLACVLMATGLVYELIVGGAAGYWIFSIGCFATVVGTKLRGK